MVYDQAGRHKKVGKTGELGRAAGGKGRLRLLGGEEKRLEGENRRKGDLTYPVSRVIVIVIVFARWTKRTKRTKRTERGCLLSVVCLIRGTEGRSGRRRRS